MIAVVPVDLELARRADRAEAQDSATVAEHLAALYPASSACAWPVAGGHLVLVGHDYGYVNRAVAVGLDQPVTREDFAFIEDRSRAIGVPPEIEVFPWSDPSVAAIASERNYREREARTLLVRRAGEEIPSSPDPELTVTPVRDEDDLEQWTAVGCAGFGHTTPAQTEVMRRWGSGVRNMGGDRLLLASRAARTVAIASLSVQRGVALLGGMTTIPDARNQGVQASLIAYRLARAAELGCELAASTAAPGSTSERNLRRGGLEPAGAKTILRLGA
jgi:GNAT superfamily N-acetyltransferase